MIQIESPFKIGQEVYHIEWNEISKVKIRGAFEEPQKDWGIKTVYVIVVKSRPLLTLKEKIFATFDEAKETIIKNQEKNIESAKEELKAIQEKADDIELTPELLEPLNKEVNG